LILLVGISLNVYSQDTPNSPAPPGRPVEVPTVKSEILDGQLYNHPSGATGTSRLIHFAGGVVVSQLSFNYFMCKHGDLDKAKTQAFAVTVGLSVVKEGVIAIVGGNRFNYCHLGSAMLGAFPVAFRMTIPDKCIFKNR